MTLSSLLSKLMARTAAIGFEKQIRLADLVEGLEWNLDCASGVLSFGDAYRWQTQFLGTESAVDRTWRWAWANTDNAVPERLLDAARAMRTFGIGGQLPELIDHESSLTVIDGHTAAVMASAICRAGAISGRLTKRRPAFRKCLQTSGLVLFKPA